MRKKLVIAFLVGTMVFSMAACGKTAEGSGEKTKTAENVESNGEDGDFRKVTPMYVRNMNFGTVDESKKPTALCMTDKIEVAFPFNFADADYYENMDDESYEPDDMMEGSVDIMTKTYYENVYDVINHKESTIFVDSKYYGNLAK